MARKYRIKDKELIFLVCESIRASNNNEVVLSRVDLFTDIPADEESRNVIVK